MIKLKSKKASYKVDGSSNIYVIENKIEQLLIWSARQF